MQLSSQIPIMGTHEVYMAQSFGPVEVSGQQPTAWWGALNTHVNPGTRHERGSSLLSSSHSLKLIFFLTLQFVVRFGGGTHFCLHSRIHKPTVVVEPAARRR